VVPDELHARGDVYSFAVLAFVLLAGRPPFLDLDPHALLRAHATSQPPPLSAVSDRPAAFDEPLVRALAKDPLARVARAGELMAQLDRAAQGLDRSGRPHHLLIVDDDASHQQLHRVLLRMSLPAAWIETANDAADALALVDRYPIAVLVVDLAMPGVSGLALAREVRRRSPSTRVVVVTGQGSGAERTVAVGLGVQHFLIKPVEPDELTRCVLECVATAEAR
jgi:ActR/RegA family two-component response regulator